MMKLLKYLAIIILSVVILDVVAGLVMRKYVKNHEMPGDYRSLDYLLKNFNNDALILGSSVALNSLDPVAIGDSLGLDMYNGASNGQTFTYQLVMLKSILKNHVPKVILLGIEPTDLSTTGNGQRINLLTPYYDMGYDDIDKVLENQGNLSHILMKSSLYRYNTIWFRILLYHISEPGVLGSKGFIAKPIPSVFPSFMDVDMEYDSMSEQRREEFAEFLDICSDNNIILVMVFPPRYVNLQGDFHATPVYKEVLEMLGERGMTLYDDTDNPHFTSDSTLFYDNYHLNADGAAVYTDYFINRLRNDSIF